MARSNAAPMEFDWDDGCGPMDPNSPFLSAIQRHKSSQTTHHPKRLSITHVGSRTCLTPTGPRNEFESPTRSINSAFPSLRPAAGQTTLFSNHPRPPSPKKKPLPPTPLDDFRTPRKFDIDFSSGGETPNTPDNADADSEATPDMRAPAWMSPSRPNVAQQDERKTSPKKPRDSFLGRIWSPSSRSALKPYSTKAEQRVVKRRHRRMFSRARPHEEPDSGAERTSREASKPGGGVHGFLSSYLKLVEQHPNAPSILITYLQLLSNFLLVLMSMYVVWTLWCGILGDVDKGVSESMAEAALKVAACKEDWAALRCDDKLARTAATCEEIRQCLARDPATVGRAQVSARTFARIINEFAEPISLKAMVRLWLSYIPKLTANAGVLPLRLRHLLVGHQRDVERAAQQAGARAHEPAVRHAHAAAGHPAPTPFGEHVHRADAVRQLLPAALPAGGAGSGGERGAGRRGEAREGD
jgi:Di-sulfide bridge nucleocytoplasmic transport domain